MDLENIYHHFKAAEDLEDFIQRNDFVEETPSENYLCSNCGSVFWSSDIFIQHWRECNRTNFPVYKKEKTNFKCLYCDKNFDTNLKLEYHLAITHRCVNCLFSGSKEEVKSHFCFQTGEGIGILDSDIVNDSPFFVTKALKGYVRNYRQRNKRPFVTFADYMEKIQPYVKSIILHNIRALKSIKCQISVRVKFKRYLRDNEYEFQEKIIQSYAHIVLNSFYFDEFISAVASKLDNTISLFQEYGSGWIFDSVLGMDLRVGIYRPFKGGGGCRTRLPLKIVNKKCVVNVKSYDQKCFIWAVSSVLYKTEHGRSCKYTSYVEQSKALKTEGITFPVELDYIPKFENENELSVNVFSFDNIEGIIPEYISPNNMLHPRYKVVNLLLTIDHNSLHSHFSGIRDFSKLLGSRNNKRKEVCFNCLQRMSADQLPDHQKLCRNFNAQKIKMPTKKNAILEFKNFRNKMRRNYVIYADLECLLKPSLENQEEISNTEIIDTHVPSGYGYVIIRNDGKVINHRVYRGEDCIDKLFDELSYVADKLNEINLLSQPMKITKRERLKLIKEAKRCHICDNCFTKDDVKVIDHDHFKKPPNNIRGVSHQICNANYHQDTKIPVIFHNLTGYDSHFIASGFAKYGKKFNIVPNNSEKFMSFSVDNLLFLDSCKFLQASLENLVTDLTNEVIDKFQILTTIFGPDSDLLKRKSVYCYEYFTNWERFKETKLPEKEHYYNSLSKEHISDEDYEYAKMIYEKFELKNLGELHNFYLLTDVALLSCVFENFRDTALLSYQLDPVNYISLPHFTLDCALKMTKERVELITDINMYQFLELGIRGGISCITKREANADNHYINPDKSGDDQSYIMMYDVVNLYGHSLSDYLPYKNFKWLTPSEIESFDVTIVDEKSDLGYILMVDLEYGKELHDRDNDFPLAVESMCVDESLLSPYQKELIDKLNIKYNNKQKKLVPNLFDKKEYITHYRNLKYYVQKGLKITKIHKILSFDQKQWLKPYIDFNTVKRSQAKSDAEKNFYKLLNNSLFGKTMENKRKRIKVEIVKNPKRAKFLLAKPSFKYLQIIKEGSLCAFIMENQTVTLDKPIGVGMCVLDNSKLLCHSFHLDKMKKWYGSNAELLHQDTDSLTYLIHTKCVYEDMLQHSDEFDTSDYPTNHKCFSLKNKKVLGKMSDEMKGEISLSFIGLAPKCYCILGSTFQKKAAKGVPAVIRKKELSYDLYKSVLKDQRKFFCVSNSITSKSHAVHTTQNVKLGLLGFDSKRYILDDGINTLSFGHYKICNN